MRKALAAMAAAVMVLVPVVSAEAATTHTPKPKAKLSLTISEGNGSWSETVSLRCTPPGGTYPVPWRACVALNRVEGKMPRLPDQGRICTKEFAPVDVSAYGTWHGREISYMKTYPNRCVAASATDGVFDF